MTLSEIKALLARDQIQLTKSLGQNFLHDANQLRRIVAAAELTRQDRVLEVGPGLGPLTELLLSHAGEVLAIEKDARLVEVLRERLAVGQASSLSASSLSRPPAGPAVGELDGTTEPGWKPALQLIHDDALDYLRREPRDWTDWKLVANLPYSAASPILVELAQSPRGPRRMVATLQTEVARRLMARPGGKDYGVLTLLVQLGYAPKTSFKIPATCFFPQPDVGSACVVLARREPPWLAPELRVSFVRIVKRSFCQRRKMMLKLLKQDWPEAAVTQAFAQLKLPPQTRAEMVGLEQFVRLASLLRSHES